MSKIHPIIPRIGSTIIGLLIGLVAAVSLSALADTTPSSWTAPTSSPPNSNVAAPINVGSLYQAKTGPLQLNGGLGVVGTFVYLPSIGSAPAPGSVLMAVDSNGTAEWVATSSLNITINNNTITGSSHGSQIFTTWTVPAGVTSVYIQAWGQGGGGAAGPGTGGSAGGYSQTTISVVPGNILRAVSYSVYPNQPHGFGGTANSNNCTLDTTPDANGLIYRQGGDGVGINVTKNETLVLSASGGSGGVPTCGSGASTPGGSANNGGVGGAVGQSGQMPGGGGGGGLVTGNFNNNAGGYGAMGQAKVTW